MNVNGNPGRWLRCGWLLLALALPLVTGCSKVVPKQTLEQARALVQEGLDAWKKGERAEALKDRPTPIQFQDEDWKRGYRLLSYEVTSTDGAAGDLTPRCSVLLTLQDRRGRKVQKQIVYNVDLKSPVNIVRDPYF